MNPEIKKLFPNYNDEELKEIEKRLREYSWIILRIVDHLVADPDAMKKYKAFVKHVKKRPPTDV